jgi:hypothetical protein
MHHNKEEGLKGIAALLQKKRREKKQKADSFDDEGTVEPSSSKRQK